MFHEQSAKDSIAFETRDHEQTAAASERLAAEADGFAAAKSRLEARFARREARIDRAHNRIQEKISAEINARDEECKSQAQQGLIEAEQQRDEKLAQTATAFGKFQQRLADDTAAFLNLGKIRARAPSVATANSAGCSTS